jgi:hypothetical protein
VFLAVILAVSTAEFGGDGWESNPPRTPHSAPQNGFEDRGPAVEWRAVPSAAVQPLEHRSSEIVRPHPPRSADLAVILAVVDRADVPPSKPSTVHESGQPKRRFNPFNGLWPYRIVIQCEVGRWRTHRSTRGSCG